MQLHEGRQHRRLHEGGQCHDGSGHHLIRVRTGARPPLVKSEIILPITGCTQRGRWLGVFCEKATAMGLLLSEKVLPLQQKVKP